jgi:hypothetical protein
MELNSWYRLTTETGEISIVYYCVNPHTQAKGFASAVPGVPFIEEGELISTDRIEAIAMVPADKYQAERTEFALLVQASGRLITNENIQAHPSDVVIIQGVLNRRAQAFSDTHQSLV